MYLFRYLWDRIYSLYPVWVFERLLLIRRGINGSCCLALLILKGGGSKINKRQVWEK